MRERLSRHWFFLALAVCLTTGHFGVDWVRPVRQSPLFRDGVVFVVMTLMGLTLHSAAIRNSFQRPLPSLLAILINVAWVPLLAILFRPLLSDVFYGGLIVAALVPCTLASASVWTRKAGGDESIAILTTVVTNLACIVVMPIGMSWLLERIGVQVSAADQMKKLALVVVLPILLAQLARGVGAATWADRRRIQLSSIAQIGILIMVTLGAAAGADSIAQDEHTRSASLASFWVSACFLTVSAVAIHLGALATGIALARVTGATRAEQIAVGISGSQKTLMVGIQMAIDVGVSVFPMIVYHIAQLVLDTVVADRWKKSSSTQE
jgi:solute carrier family 10 (sodium/bile acid cotransporter), member 7